jgi:tetratricopeptide (TPR) repeat protein
MALPLLTTKFYIPPVLPGQVSRPRLITRLNEGLNRKLILISAPAGFGKTTLLSEWNDLETALRYAGEGLDLSKQWGQADALIQCYLSLTRVLHARGEMGSALDTIQEAKHLAGSLGPWYVVTTGAYEAGIRLAQGDLAAARWVQESGLGVGDELSIDYCASYLTLARTLSAQGRPDETLGLLARLLVVREAAGAVGSAIDTLVLQSLILRAQGQGRSSSCGAGTRPRPRRARGLRARLCRRGGPNGWAAAAGSSSWDQFRLVSGAK